MNGCPAHGNRIQLNSSRAVNQIGATPQTDCRRTKAVEPSHSPAHKANGRGLLLVRQNLDVGQASGVVDGHVDTFVADASRAALLPVTGDAVTDLAKAGLLFDIDVDQVAKYIGIAVHGCVGLDWWLAPHPVEASHLLVS